MRLALDWYCNLWQRLDRWRGARFPNVRSAWIRKRRLELIDERDAEHENDWGAGHDWRNGGAEDQARSEWRIAQHRSWLGLRHRLVIASDWALVLCFWVSLTWPVLLLAGWAISHVRVVWE